MLSGAFNNVKVVLSATSNLLLVDVGSRPREKLFHFDISCSIELLMCDVVHLRNNVEYTDSTLSIRSAFLASIAACSFSLRFNFELLSVLH